MTEVTFEIDDLLQLPLPYWTVLVKTRAGFKCEMCGGQPTRFLEAHHIDNDRNNNCLTNGMCL